MNRTLLYSAYLLFLGMLLYANTTQAQAPKEKIPAISPAKMAMISGGVSPQLIVYDPTAGPVSVPFDQAFILQIKGFPASAHIRQVNVYQKTNRFGERKFVHTEAEIKAKSDSYGAQFQVAYKIVSGGLNLTFPAVRPNTSFDVAVVSDLTANQVKTYLALNKAIEGGDQQKIYQAFQTTRDSTSYISQSSNRDTILSGYGRLKTYRSLYDKNMQPLYQSLFTAGKYQAFTPFANVDLQTTVQLLDLYKISDYGVYLFGHTAPDPLRLGLQALNDKLSDAAADQYDFDTRLLNLKKTISILDSVSNNLEKLKKRSADPAVTALSDLVARNSTALQANRDTLTKYYNAIKKVLISSDATNYTWVLTNNSAKDVSTLSGSILSTEFGMTNLFFKDNTNKTVYIPKLFVGVDIFFRQTNRDIKSKDLPSACELTKYYGKDHVPEILAVNTIWQHLSLSLGLTLGSMPAPFDNFYNSFSLTAGPSYRFCRYLRLSAGPAFLKRQNPNPILTHEPVTVGYYASFSVDMNFVKAASDFFSMITK